MCVFFLLYSPFKLSFVSVVFIFNVSANDVAPVSLILLSVDMKFKKMSELLMVIIYVSSFFCFYIPY